jgi:hypothetical protein
MGSACSMHKIDEKCIKILVGKPEGGYYSEDLGVDGR